MHYFPTEYLIIYKLISPSYTITNDDTASFTIPLFANLNLSNDY